MNDAHLFTQSVLAAGTIDGVDESGIGGGGIQMLRFRRNAQISTQVRVCKMDYYLCCAAVLVIYVYFPLTSIRNSEFICSAPTANAIENKNEIN